MFTLSIRRRRIAAGVAALAFAAFAAADDKPATAPAEPDLLTNVARQAALDRAGFSPGVIDGKVGPKTLFAVREFQTARKLPATGEFDEETLKALRVASVPALETYTITAEDIADIGEFPSDWNAKARLDRLRYESLEALLGERGHCKKALLETLNPELKIGNLHAGDKLKLPFIEPDPLTEKAASLEVDLDNKTVRARDKADRTLLVFHCRVFIQTGDVAGSSQCARHAADPARAAQPRWTLLDRRQPAGLWNSRHAPAGVDRQDRLARLHPPRELGCRAAREDRRRGDAGSVRQSLIGE
ncbi:MAG: peptidoglycan-binding protein [Planctomycetes bacterium]|nr:peptidoglycan-binding protein [Planctomycetota bacterium]